MPGVPAGPRRHKSFIVVMAPVATTLPVPGSAGEPVGRANSARGGSDFGITRGPIGICFMNDDDPFRNTQKL
jgi:hypothetical protein